MTRGLRLEGIEADRTDSLLTWSIRRTDGVSRGRNARRSGCVSRKRAALCAQSVRVRRGGGTERYIAHHPLPSYIVRAPLFLPQKLTLPPSV